MARGKRCPTAGAGCRLDAGGAPPPDRIIGFGDSQAFTFPQLRWSVCHMQLLMPTRAVTEVMAERLWSRLGADFDGYFTVDSIGTPFAGGGFNASLRDMARVGQLLLDGDRVGDEQVIPAAVIRSIRQGGDQAAFARAGDGQLPGWSYLGMWWVSHDAHGTFMARMARGVHGQSLWIDPTTQVVIARFATHPTASHAANDATTLPAYAAISRHLQALDGKVLGPGR